MILDSYFLSFFIAHSSDYLSACQAAGQLRLNPSTTELLDIPGDASLCQDLVFSPERFHITPSVKALRLGVILDNQLFFSSQNVNLTHLYRFLLYNINMNVKRIWLFLSMEASQDLVQSLVILRFDKCNLILFFPACFPSMPPDPSRIQLHGNSILEDTYQIPLYTTFSFTVSQDIRKVCKTLLCTGIQVVE